MGAAYFSGQTLDDVMRSIIEALQLHGDAIEPSKGSATELRGVLLEIANPRSRLSRTETRGRLFSALGEFCWYLAKSNKLGFIGYYISKYSEAADGDEIFGGYGPRLFDWKGTNQVENIIARLKANPHSRKAVIQLFDATDIVQKHNDVPCTCTLQFMKRHDKLHVFVNMRSNDIHSSAVIWRSQPRCGGYSWLEPKQSRVCGRRRGRAPRFLSAVSHVEIPGVAVLGGCGRLSFAAHSGDMLHVFPRQPL
jgi:hypothetical protein